MFDLTVGNIKEFETLPEDTWILARLAKREVVRWVELEHKFATSADEVLIKLMQKAKKVEGDDVESRVVQDEIKSYQFSFTFKVIEGKKYAGYYVKGRTGIWLNFEKTDGTFQPNKLAQFYLGAGGIQPKVGEKTNIDSVMGNYVAIKLESNKNQKTKKVYQQVVKVRELTDDELIRAKSIELEVNKIENALKEAEEKTEQAHVKGLDAKLTQTPVLDTKEQNIKDIPF